MGSGLPFNLREEIEPSEGAAPIGAAEGDPSSTGIRFTEEPPQKKFHELLRPFPGTHYPYDLQPHCTSVSSSVNADIKSIELRRLLN